MRCKFIHLTLLAAGLLAATPMTARADVQCPEGKTWSGACVRPGLAATMRESAIVFAQPKISLQAYPILPVEDWLYRYPRQLIPNLAKPAPAYLKSP
jgi:hypothetical protein